MAFPFFPDVFYLSLAVLGASMADLDHHVKKKNLTIMALSGVLLAVTLYFLKLPFLLGVILVALASIFYVSKHRGFMHSIFGAVVITASLTAFILGSYFLIQNFFSEPKVSLIAVSLILGFIVLNKKLIPIFTILVLFGIILTPNMALNPYLVFGAFFIGCLSHIILDLFTPSGVELFNPLSPHRYKKACGIFLMVLWSFGVFLILYRYINGYF